MITYLINNDLIWIFDILLGKDKVTLTRSYLRYYLFSLDNIYLIYYLDKFDLS